MTDEDNARLRKRVAILEAELARAQRRFELLAAADNEIRNGVVPSVGAADCRLALERVD